MTGVENVRVAFFADFRKLKLCLRIFQPIRIERALGAVSMTNDIRDWAKSRLRHSRQSHREPNYHWVTRMWQKRPTVACIAGITGRKHALVEAMLIAVCVLFRQQGHSTRDCRDLPVFRLSCTRTLSDIVSCCSVWLWRRPAVKPIDI